MTHHPTPDHIHDTNPELEFTTCPECDGKGYIECYGSAWGINARPDLNFAYKPCQRCNHTGQILNNAP